MKLIKIIAGLPLLRLCWDPLVVRWIELLLLETVDLGSIPRRVKPKTIKLILTAFLLDFQKQKGQCEASTVCGR